MSLPDVLDRAATDDLIGLMQVSTLLACLPGVGEAGAAYIMEQLGIASSRRVGSLSQQAREALMGELPQVPPPIAAPPSSPPPPVPPATVTTGAARTGQARRDPSRDPADPPTGQANYCFNVVATDSRSGGRPVTWHREPRAFAGTADQFAQAMLDEVMSGDPRLAGEFVFVNVWDSDREGVFDARHIAGRASHDPQAAIRRSAPVEGGALPDTGSAALVLRTDFSDDTVWDAVCAASAEDPRGYPVALSFVSDPAFADMTVDQVAALTTASYRTYLFIVDHVTITVPEMPLVAVDMHDEPGRWFRVVPRQMAGVEVNLSLANMSFREFADHVDPDGVFRGFPGEPR